MKIIHEIQAQLENLDKCSPEHFFDKKKELKYALSLLRNNEDVYADVDPEYLTWVWNNLDITGTGCSYNYWNKRHHKTEVVEWLKDRLEEHGDPSNLIIEWDDLDVILNTLDKKIRETYSPSIG